MKSTPSSIAEGITVEAAVIRAISLGTACSVAPGARVILSRDLARNLEQTGKVRILREIVTKMRFARRAAGLSQLDVARAIGVSEKTFARYELGDAQPSPTMVGRIAQFLKVPATQLYVSVAEDPSA